MRISEKWLREWVSPRLNTRALSERLTLAGLEVGAIEAAGPTLDKVVVGEVRAVEHHPNAAHLHVCQVATGGKTILQIVCGAPNVAVGQRVPTALIGARLPNGTSLAQTEIRGIESRGMLCSAADLGLADDSDGLLVLDPRTPVGRSIHETLSLDDTILEIDLTPNRADCLSIAGVAREVAVLTGAKFKAPKFPAIRAKSQRRINISLKAPVDCPRYIGRIIENVNAKAVTPIWMRERLRRGGIRSIHPIVDVTNYVMLELGQPLHAFDLDRLSKGVVVRAARANEPIHLLDGTERKLEAGTLVIADANEPVAIAGIMGGTNSAVSDSTENILLESAYFRPGAIAGRARALGLQTESSHRFERGVDPELQQRAAERGTELILKICGGTAGPVVARTSARHLPRQPAVSLRRQRIVRVLGMALSERQVTSTLQKLGMRVTRNANVWRVGVPSFRFDISREEDLIEELARVHGYDRLPTKLPKIRMDPGSTQSTSLNEGRIRSALIDRDYQEVITYSFVDPNLQSVIEPQVGAIPLRNPIASDLGVMRTSLWAGLLRTLLYNINRQQTRVRIFELGRCFLRVDGVIEQPKRVGGLVYGSALAEQWGSPDRAVDFFDLKGDVEGLLGLGGRAADFHYESGVHPALHPRQCARILDQTRPIGWMGALHPEIAQKMGIPASTGLFELELAAIMQGTAYKYAELSKFPSIRIDLAVIINDETPAQAVMDSVRDVAGKLLVNLELFDEYRGESIDSGRKSLALALTLQDSSRTLKEADVETIRNRVVVALREKLGGELRG